MLVSRNIVTYVYTSSLGQYELEGKRRRKKRLALIAGDSLLKTVAGFNLNGRVFHHQHRQQYNPTGLFAILVLSIYKFYVVQERRGTDLKLPDWKRVGREAC